jgi:Ras-related C3 botulinum toxin substrate 1
MWDTAGREDYDQLRVLAYPDTKIVLICFSIVNPASLDSIRCKWIPEVRQHCPDAPVILVGTKIDLREGMKCEQQSLVTSDMGEALARDISAHKYMECSAKTSEGVKNLFEEAARAAMRQRKKERSWKRKCIIC